jgi:hypothetical protein
MLPRMTEAPRAHCFAIYVRYGWNSGSTAVRDMPVNLYGPARAGFRNTVVGRMR